MKPRFPESAEERAARLIGTAMEIGAPARADRLESVGAAIPSIDDVARKMEGRLRGAGLESADAEPVSRLAAREGVSLIADAARGELRLEDVSSGQLANLEAVISVIGRPAWFARNNAPDVEDELDAADEAWLVHIGRQLAGIKRACARVAAIFMEHGGQRTEIGTGWMIGDGLLATNAHVARHLFFPYFSAPADDPAGGWRPRPGVSGTADFRFERGGSASGPFAIGVSCFIESDENSQPDLAVLAVEPRDGAPPPTALDLELDRAGNWDRRRVFAVGHPVADVNDDANVAIVFGELDGTKRISPGEARGLLGDFVLAHDCATVNGSSGSPILDFGTAKVVGLHYWGEPGARNESIFLPAIHDHPAIVKSLAAGFGG